jgi:hypothetical protein
LKSLFGLLDCRVDVLEVRVWSLAGGDFSLLSIHTGCGVHWAPFHWVSIAASLGVKWVGCEVDHSVSEAKHFHPPPHVNEIVLN